MSKRFGGKINPVHSLAHKKPKLDVSVSSSTSKNVKKRAPDNPPTNGQNFNMLPPRPPANQKAAGTEIRNPISIKTKSSDLNSQLDIQWVDDDDDDEFLIAASQIEEESNKSVQYSFTCTQFNNESNLASSTQKPPPVQNNKNNNDKLFDIPISIFDNESFEIDFESTTMEPSQSTNHVEQMNSVKPQSSLDNRDRDVSFRNILIENNNHNRNQHLPNELTSNRCKKDQDAMQISELVKRLNDLEAETKNQKNIINDQTEKIQNKEGEVSVLRFDLKHLKTQVDGLKIEKIKEAENIKKSWEDRIEEWKRKYNATQLELNIKSNEIMKLKQKSPESKILEVKKSFKLFSSLNLLHIEELVIKNNEIQMCLDLFRSFEKKHDTFIDQFVQQELDMLYSSLIALQNNTSVIHTDNFIDGIKHSLGRTFNKLSAYFENLRHLEFTKNSSIASESSTKINDLDLNSIDLKCLKSNQMQRMNLNNVKRFQAMQGYIIIFGLICEKIPKLVEFLNAPIPQSFNSNEVNQTPINIMNHSADVLLHLNSYECESGVFESYAFLLNCIAKANQVNSENITLLKALLFKHRPSLRTLLYITEALLNIAKNSTESLDLLCDKTEGKSCHYNVEKKLLYIQQNESCCVIQVYCTIFELTMNNEYDFKENSMIFLLLEKYLLFSRQCFTKPPHFIFKSSDKNCKCFYKLSKTFVNILYLIINRWNNNVVNMPDLIRLKLYKLGSLLVCNFYRHKSDVIHSITFLSLKHKLYIICEWLDSCREILKLKNGTFDVAINYVKSSFIFENTMDKNKNINSQKGVELMKSTFKLI